MIHDELLKVLTDVIEDDVHYLATQTSHALRAVVELHKPEIFHNGIENITVCEECNYEYSSDNENLYPCQTITKIKEQLQ